MDERHDTPGVDRLKHERFGGSLLATLRQRVVKHPDPRVLRQAMTTLAGVSSLCALFYRASELYSRGEYAAALAEWKRIHAGLSHKVPGDSKPERATLLSSMCLAAMKLGDLTEAVQYGKRAVALARETPCRNIEAEALSHLGNAHRGAKNITAAVKCRTAAIWLFRTLGDARGEAMEVSGLGNLEYEQGNLKKAIELHQEALHLVRASRGYDVMPRIMQNLEHCQATLIEQRKKDDASPAFPPDKMPYIHRGEELLSQAESGLRRRDWQSVEIFATQAHEAFVAADVPVGIVASSHMLAGALAERKLWHQALKPSKEVVDTCRQHGLIGGLETGLKNLFRVLAELDDVPGCIACLEEELDLAMAHGKCADAGPALKSLGEYMRRLGKHEQAKECQLQAVEIFEHLGDRYNSAIALDELSAIANAERDFDDALEYSDRAQEVFAQLRKTYDVAVCRGNRGQILMRIGDRAGAAEELAEALATFKGHPPGRNLIGVLQALGSICTEEGMFAEATRLYERGHQLAQRLGDQELTSRLELASMDLQIRVGGLPVTRLKRLLQSAHLPEEVRLEAVCQLARVERMRKNHGSALELLNETIRTVESRGYGILADLLLERSRTYAEMQNYEAAESDVRRGIDLMERSLDELSSAEHGLHYVNRLHSVVDPYRDLVLVLSHQSNRSKDTFEATELARGRVFLRLLGEANTSIPWSTGVDVAAQLGWTEFSLRGARGRLRQGKTEQDRAEAARECRFLARRRRATLERLKTTVRDYGEFKQGAPASFASTKNLLSSRGEACLKGDGTACEQRVVLAEYFISDGVVHLFIIRHDFKEPRLIRLRLKEPVLDLPRYVTDTLGTSAAVRGMQDSKLEEWHRRFEPFVRPVLDCADEEDVIWFVPHDVLHLVPLHAVRVDGRYLIERNPICYTPGASVMKYCHAKRKRRCTNAVVVGDSCDNLAHAREEAYGVAKLFNAEPVIGSAATKARILALLEEQRDRIDVLHFACHGYFDHRHALKSGIMLAPEPAKDASQRQRDTATLTAEEIFDLQLNVDLVTLSACDSGVSERRPGDELMGLTRALMYAGARSVLVSLWAVDDLSTQLTMEQFYRELLRKAASNKAHSTSTVEALRSAQRYVMNLTARELVGHCEERLAEYDGRDGLQRQTCLELDCALARGLAGEVRAAVSAYESVFRGLASNASRRTRQLTRYVQHGLRVLENLKQCESLPREDGEVFGHPFYWAPFVLVGDWR